MSNRLTAEQVREAIFNGSSYTSFDGTKYYADGIGMQAVADELNAVLNDVSDDESNGEAHKDIDTQSRWYQLFGTPEKAAHMLHSNGTLACRECIMRDECMKTPEDSDCMILHHKELLEWLKGEAE